MATSLIARGYHSYADESEQEVCEGMVGWSSQRLDT